MIDRCTRQVRAVFKEGSFRGIDCVRLRIKFIRRNGDPAYKIIFPAVLSCIFRQGLTVCTVTVQAADRLRTGLIAAAGFKADRVVPGSIKCHIILTGCIGSDIYRPACRVSPPTGKAGGTISCKAVSRQLDPLTGDRLNRFPGSLAAVGVKGNRNGFRLIKGDILKRNREQRIRLFVTRRLDVDIRRSAVLLIIPGGNPRIISRGQIDHITGRSDKTHAA